MSWRHPAWDAIGIEPTTDTRAIRTAYARRLKAIDVEADPAAFVALREAFEAAQAMAPWVDHQDEEEDEEDESWDEVEEEDDEASALLDPRDRYGLYPAGPFGSAAPESLDAPPLGADGGERLVGVQWEDDALRIGADPPSPPPRDDSPPPRPGPWQPVTPADTDAHARALAAMLLDGDTSRWSTAEEDAAMLAHWHALVADPRMQQVSFYADAERWFAQILPGTTPFSDALVLPVTRYFRWMDADGSISQSYGHAEITSRYRVLEFMESAQNPASPHHEAWRELVTPAGPGSFRGKISIKKVHRLIHLVRSHYPDLEGCFDSYRVEMWKPPAHQPDAPAQRMHDRAPPPRRDWFGQLGAPGWIVAIFIAIGLFVTLVGDPDRNRPGTAPPASVEAGLFGSGLDGTGRVSDRDADIQGLLRRAGDGSLDWPDVQTRNPALAKVLTDAWDRANREGAVRNVFFSDTRPLLEDRFFDGLRRADYELIAAHRRLVADKARALRATDPRLCGDFFDGRPVEADAIPEAIKDRERALFARVLLAADARDLLPPGSGRVAIPARARADAARRAGMTEPRLRGALAGRGTPSDQCDARIALVEAALALPQSEGLKLLREM